MSPARLQARLWSLNEDELSTIEGNIPSLIRKCAQLSNGVMFMRERLTSTMDRMESHAKRLEAAFNYLEDTLAGDPSAGGGLQFEGEVEYFEDEWDGNTTQDDLTGPLAASEMTGR